MGQKKVKAVSTASIMDSAEVQVQNVQEQSSAHVTSVSTTSDLLGESETRRSLASESITSLMITAGRIKKNDDGSIGLNPEDSYISSMIKQIGFGIAMAGKSDALVKFQQDVLTNGTANAPLSISDVFAGGAVNQFEFARALVIKTNYYDRPVTNGFSSAISAPVNVQVTIGADRAMPAVFYKDPANMGSNTGEYKDGSRVLCRQDAAGRKTNSADIKLANGSSLRFMPVELLRAGYVDEAKSTLEVIALVNYNLNPKQVIKLMVIGTLGSANASKVNEEVSYTLDKDMFLESAFVTVPFNSKAYTTGFYISQEQNAEFAGYVFEALSNAYPAGVINTNLGYRGRTEQIQLAK